IPMPCAVTAAQYLACVSDRVAAFNADVGKLASCTAVTRKDLEAIWGLVAGDPPASCASLTNTCAGLDVPVPHPGTIENNGSGVSGGGPASAGAGGSPGAGGS